MEKIYRILGVTLLILLLTAIGILAVNNGRTNRELAELRRDYTEAGMKEIKTGRRIYPTDFSSLEGIQPGDYWKDPKHGWFAACPIVVAGIPATENDLLLATLCKHTVIEHENGTITVSPSILVGGDYSGIAPREWVDAHTWHGWLECGAWRTA